MPCFRSTVQSTHSPATAVQKQTPKPQSLPLKAAFFDISATESCPVDKGQLWETHVVELTVSHGGKNDPFWERKRHAMKLASGNWSSHCITPGTMLSYQLDSPSAHWSQERWWNFIIWAFRDWFLVTTLMAWTVFSYLLGKAMRKLLLCLPMAEINF